MHVCKDNEALSSWTEESDAGGEYSEGGNSVGRDLGDTSSESTLSIDDQGYENDEQVHFCEIFMPECFTPFYLSSLVSFFIFSVSFFL